MPAGVFTTAIGAGTPLSTEAAVAMTREPEPGAPAMKKVSLALPAEVTTITPARAALSEDTAVAVMALPKFDPRDMLMTSRWSEGSLSLFGSIAKSMARVVRPVLPKQPKTRKP